METPETWPDHWSLEKKWGIAHMSESWIWKQWNFQSNPIETNQDPRRILRNWIIVKNHVWRKIGGSFRPDFLCAILYKGLIWLTIFITFCVCIWRIIEWQFNLIQSKTTKFTAKMSLTANWENIVKEMNF